MGTMLAQKKPLESIQRSQAINFVAEIFYDELQFILDRRLLDHTMVNCHGMNSRVKSRDVLSVSEQHVATTNAGKEYILLNLARNSIYHQLPELLFHPLVLSTPGMSNKEIVEAIRANEKQDKELIQFFAPFDTEFFKEKVRINNRHLNFFSDPDSKKNFIKMIEVMENVELSITPHQKYKLFLFLCNAELLPEFSDNIGKKELRVLRKQFKRQKKSINRSFYRKVLPRNPYLAQIFYYKTGVMANDSLLNSTKVKKLKKRKVELTDFNSGYTALISKMKRLEDMYQRNLFRPVFIAGKKYYFIPKQLIL